MRATPLFESADPDLRHVGAAFDLRVEPLRRHGWQWAEGRTPARRAPVILRSWRRRRAIVQPRW